MVINTEEFKKVCSSILSASDGSEISTLTETLELKTKGRVLYLCTTNKEYYASVKFQLEHEEDFHASVNATLFLKLIAAVTSDTVELTLHDNYMLVKANGNYKIPLIFENDKMMEVPAIVIENKTVEMNISSAILETITNYNTKEILNGTAAKPIQKMFYVDNEGCITFTPNSACVNTFSLEKPVRLLFNQRLVNLFKLFKGQLVKFSLGYDNFSDTIIQTKVSFETDTITLTAITGCDDTLVNDVPAAAIRGRANKQYDSKVVFNAAALKEAIDRLLIFSAGYGTKQNLKPYSTFEFSGDKVVIYDSKKENTEVLTYENGTILSQAYTMTLDLVQVKKILESSNDQYVTINFGDNKACVVVRNAIKNVISEVTSKKVEPAA